jgi:hypothetical protein
LLFIFKIYLSSNTRKEESDDWKGRFWSRDEISDDELEVENFRKAENFENVKTVRNVENIETVRNVENVKKSSTVLTRRRMPDGIGILRLSFSSPGSFT